MRLRTLTVASAIALGGCGDICGDEGCTRGVSVNAATAPASDLLTGATYRVEIEADGETRSCELTIGEDELCTSGGVLQVVPDAAALEIVVTTSPASLRVRVLRDGTLLGESRYDVEYTREHVDNGGGACDMDCTSGGEKELTLTTPPP